MNLPSWVFTAGWIAILIQFAVLEFIVVVLDPTPATPSQNTYGPSSSNPQDDPDQSSGSSSRASWHGSSSTSSPEAATASGKAHTGAYLRSTPGVS